jgi:DNA-binding transcriptional MerR regulator
MAKAPDAFLTIGEMAERLGVRTHILRYWEEQFPMLQPLKRAGGRRLYRPTDVALLEQIKDLLDGQGFTIRGARQYLRSGNHQQPAVDDLQAVLTAVTPMIDMPNLAIVKELRAVRTRLATALAAA